jgi:biopolymer transport protein ExbB
MWPLLACSLLAMTVVGERLFFIIKEKSRRDERVVAAMLDQAEAGNLAEAQEIGAKSEDFVARVLSAGLRRQKESLSAAILHASGQELERFNRGLTTLDTIITLAPLLGLLGTVTGMIRTFGLLGGTELGAPAAVTGGIAEALIATAFGLAIAMLALIPFNFLNARLEKARREVESAATQLEMALK